jgi:hypothetical protein
MSNSLTTRQPWRLQDLRDGGRRGLGYTGLRPLARHLLRLSYSYWEQITRTLLKMVSRPCALRSPNHTLTLLRGGLISIALAPSRLQIDTV